jgi:excisionase family DNA binding protein
MPEQQYADWNQLPLLLTVEEAAGLLRVHRNTIKRLLREGKLAGTKVGRAWRVRREVLMAFVAAGGAAEGDKS